MIDFFNNNFLWYILNHFLGVLERDRVDLAALVGEGLLLFDGTETGLAFLAAGLLPRLAGVDALAAAGALALEPFFPLEYVRYAIHRAYTTRTVPTTTAALMVSSFTSPKAILGKNADKALLATLLATFDRDDMLLLCPVCFLLPLKLKGAPVFLTVTAASF